MSSVDSEAVFFALVAKLGLAEYIPKFVECGWRTHGHFAFSANYAPGHPDDSNLRNEVVARLTGDDNHPLLATIRRLFFESYTQYAREAQRQVEPTHEAAPREVPGAERKYRLAELRSTYPSLEIVDDLIPSNTLVDKFVQMQEKSNLLYLPWTEIGRRDQEVRGQKREPYWAKSPAGVLVEHTMSTDFPADVSTSLKLSRMFQRRGFALEIARLMSSKAHSALVKWLMKGYQKDPLPGWSAVTLAQVELADKEVFVRLGEDTQDGLDPDPTDGTLPLDNLLKHILSTDLDLAMILMPSQLPVGGAGSGAKRSAHEMDNDAEYKARPAKKSRAEKRQEKVKKFGNDKDKGKGKGAGKSSGKDRDAGTQNLPKGMQGMVSAYHGKRLCFGYNLPTGCSGKVDPVTHECSKGLHICARPKCHGNHSAQHRDCPENRK